MAVAAGGRALRDRRGRPAHSARTRAVAEGPAAGEANGLLLEGRPATAAGGRILGGAAGPSRASSHGPDSAGAGSAPGVVQTAAAGAVVGQPRAKRAAFTRSPRGQESGGVSRAQRVGTTFRTRQHRQSPAGSQAQGATQAEEVRAGA